MRSTRTALAVVALVGTLLALGTGADPAHATADFTITRLAGDTRAATAANIALATFPAPSGAQQVLISRDDDFPDALAGNYSAGLLSAPLLLTARTGLTPITRTAIQTLGARAAVILGGTGAIPESIADELRAMGLVVSRVGGADRFVTAAQLALAAGHDAVGHNENTLRTAVLSSGINFPDALAAGPIVYRRHFPQLLTGAGSLPPATLQALRDLDIEHIIITGGAAAVPGGMETELANAGFDSVERIAGATRYTTALALANKATGAFDFGATHIDFATGENFPDALAGGPHGGRDLAPLVLVPKTTGGGDFKALCDTLQFLSSAVASGHALGGPDAIADSILTALTTCGRPVTPVTRSGQVIRVNVAGHQYTFVDDVDDTVRVVSWDGQDVFAVDGQSRTEAEFVAALAPGDDITYVDDVSVVNRDEHRLTNRVVTAGLVGNVDTSGNVLSILNPVTGDRVGGPYQWAEAGDTLKVGGSTATLAEFEGSVNEGDTIVITLTGGSDTFDLTNGALSGTVTSRSAPDGGFATFDVDDVFGDEPETPQNAVFRAQAAPPGGTAETYLINGVPAVDFAQFAVTLSVGDTISVSRSVVAGVPTERFELTNVSPAAISGQVTSFVNTAEDPSASDPSGDRVAIVPAAGGYRNVDYTGTPAITGFRVDGNVVNEAAFEAALSAGDSITFQPGSISPAVDETLSLTNHPLSGQLYAINTVIDLYGVYAADKNTLLALVAYTVPGTPALTNRYFINDQERTLAQWETEAAAVNVAPDDLDDPITVEITGNVRNHRLTTPDPLGG